MLPYIYLKVKDKTNKYRYFSVPYLHLILDSINADHEIVNELVIVMWKYIGICRNWREI